MQINSSIRYCHCFPHLFFKQRILASKNIQIDVATLLLFQGIKFSTITSSDRKQKKFLLFKVSNTRFINGIEAHWYLCISREWDLEFLVNCNPSFISKKKKPREEHWPSYIQVKDFNFCESNNNIFSRWNILEGESFF